MAGPDFRSRSVGSRGEERRKENGGLDEGIISSSRVTGYYDNMTLYVTVTVSV